jgi:CHAD domain-containing protein
VRDLDVLEDRLLAEIDEQESLLVIGPVRARTRRELRAQRRDTRDRLDDAMRSDRYLRLLAELSGLLSDPPLTERAAKKPTRMGRDVERSVRRVQRAIRRADKAADPRERDVDLHDIRKAAKRARYAAEVAQPVYGKGARRLARTMESAQEVLGEHQDAVTARPALRDLGVKAYLAGENGFTFGLLSGAEQVRADAARARYRDLRPRLRRTHLPLD